MTLTNSKKDNHRYYPVNNFNLSDKITHTSFEIKWNTSDPYNPEPIEWENKPVFHKEDIEVFIEELKKELGNIWAFGKETDTVKDLWKMVDKLSGDKLTTLNLKKESSNEN